jgi:DNA-binding NtrC family response regulator
MLHDAIAEFEAYIGALGAGLRLRDQLGTDTRSGGRLCARVLPALADRAVEAGERAAGILLPQVEQPQVEQPQVEQPQVEQPQVEQPHLGLNLHDAREQFERQYLAAQLERHGGNISRAARAIGMERASLHRKLRAVGVLTPMKGAA